MFDLMIFKQIYPKVTVFFIGFRKKIEKVSQNEEIRIEQMKPFR